MTAQEQEVYGFTLSYKRIVNCIRTPIKISEYVDPNSGGKEPKAHVFSCVWDTGATHSAISPTVAKGLGLIASGKADVTVPGGEIIIADTYLVDIELPNSVVIVGLRVSELELGDDEVLLGMDVMQEGTLAISNAYGVTTVSFQIPSVNPVDLREIIHDRKKLAAIPTMHEVMSEEENRKMRNKAKAQRQGRRGK